MENNVKIIYMSLFCREETKTALYINYTSVKFLNMGRRSDKLFPKRIYR